LSVVVLEPLEKADCPNIWFNSSDDLQKSGRVQKA
jgi:hypothetical protein